MAKKKAPDMSGERVWRVWVHLSPESDTHNTYDLIAYKAEEAATKARRMARKAFDEPCVRKVEQIAVLD